MLCLRCDSDVCDDTRVSEPESGESDAGPGSEWAGVTALSLWRSLIGQLSATLASDWLGLVCVESQAIDRSRFIAAFKCLERDIMIKWQNIKGLVNVWKYRTETEIRYGKTEILFYPLVFVRIVFIPQKITLLDQSGPFLLRVFVTILY